MFTNWYNDFIVCQYTCTGAENLHLNYKKLYKIIFPFLFFPKANRNCWFHLKDKIWRIQLFAAILQLESNLKDKG